MTRTGRRSRITVTTSLIEAGGLFVWEKVTGPIQDSTLVAVPHDAQTHSPCVRACRATYSEPQHHLNHTITRGMILTEDVYILSIRRMW